MAYSSKKKGMLMQVIRLAFQCFQYMLTLPSAAAVHHDNNICQWEARLVYPGDLYGNLAMA